MKDGSWLYTDILEAGYTQRETELICKALALIFAAVEKTDNETLSRCYKLIDEAFGTNMYREYRRQQIWYYGGG